MIIGEANWSFDPEADCWYVALKERKAPPYLTQVHVDAILDIDEDGNLAGIELVQPMRGNKVIKPPTA